jgi:lambda repressor-like predicted transcriptional regulator
LDTHPDPFGDQQKRDRNQRILEMRREGESLRNIANTVGVSHETVALVCRKNGLGRVVLAQARALPPEERKRLLAGWVSGEMFRDIAARENLYIATVKRVVEEEATERDKEARRIVVNKRRGNFGQQITNEDIYAAIRRCGDSLGGRRPTTDEYRGWASENREPSAALIQKRTSWRDAVIAAGYEPITKKGRGPQWSEEECWSAARRARDILGHAPSIGEYEETLGHRHEYPGAQTLRHRCGGWQNLTLVLHQEAVEAKAETEVWLTDLNDTNGQPTETSLAVAKSKTTKKWWKP